MAKIVIDSGHGGTANIGGSDVNHASGPNGTLEKDVTLTIAVKIAEKLNQLGHDIFLTRNSDTNLSLRNRAMVAVNNNALVFVSIHFNGDNNPSIQGTETWLHSTHTNDSKLLASSIQQRVIQVTQYNNRGLRSKRLGVLSPAVHNINTATCLVEISFITDPNDEVKLNNQNYQNKLADAISQGVIDFINRSSSINILNPVPSTDPGVDGDI